MQVNKSKDIIISYLQKNGSCPRTLLAKETGLTKAAITQITNELIKEGILIEKGEIKPNSLIDFCSEDEPPKKRGRRKVLVGINENYRLVLGITILDDGVYAGICNLNGEILQKIFPKPTLRGRQAMLECFVETYELLLKENCITADRVLGLGICVGESAEEYFETEITAELLAKIKTELSHAINVPIVVSRLAEGMLLAQRLIMKNRHEFFDSAMLISVDGQSGVSLFVNGMIYRGFSNQAGGVNMIKPAIEDFQAMIFDPRTPEQDEYLKKLAEFICFFDPEMIFIFGDSCTSVDGMASVNAEVFGFLPKGKKLRQYEMMPCEVFRCNSFLAGAAAVASQHFFNF